MARYLKEGKSKGDLQEADSRVRETVRLIIEDIDNNGDAAVRKYSEKFDNWTPESFRLTEEDIAEITASVPAGVLEDIRFAQEQIRNFATKQRESIKDI